MPLVIATGNAGKLQEFRGLLPAEIRLLTLADVGIDLPPESGETYVANAVIKAMAAAQSGYAAMADDSGLEADALRGLPGVRSARYAGVGATGKMNNDKLLRELADLPAESRTARFRSAVALVVPNRGEYVAEGSLEGRIALSPRGTNGFGYDPLFELADPCTLEENGRTIAEIANERKNRLSHRARAVRSLLTRLDALGLALSSLTGDHGDR